jgi:uncharacterized protein (DUF2141 family)
MKNLSHSTRLGALALAVGLIAAPLAAHAQASGPITVTVTGVRSTQGSVRVDVCTRETFLKKICVYSGAAPAQVGATTVTVEAVPPGTYAVQAYHDINDNKDVDQGLLGIPKEGIGFSNDAPLGLRGPSFDRAAIVHNGSPKTLRIKLRHF